MRILIIILTIMVSQLNAQTREAKQTSIKETKREFKNQGEQEDYWAEQFFKKNYSKKNYNRFKGTVTVNGNFYKFGDNYLEVTYIIKPLRDIFLKGILYPNIITGDLNITSTKKGKNDSVTASKKDIDNFWGTDSLRITDFEEVKFLSNSPKYKRFRFWLFQKFLANPTVCFIELTNENASIMTDISTFINGSKLTFFKEGWFIL